MQREPFFSRDGDTFLPNKPCRGPWNPDSINGRVVVGLIGAETESRHAQADLLPARMTVDMYRLAGFDPIRIETKVVREGRRIRVVEAEFLSDGKSMARAMFQFLRRSRAPQGEVWKPQPWNAPGPEELPASSKDDLPWELRPISGLFGTANRRSTWLRETREMVGGMAITPFQRLAAACDFVNPFSNGGSKGLSYINSDVSLLIHRLPVGEWIGLESFYHGADDGIAVGECRLYDKLGSVGLSACVGLAQAQAIIPRSSQT